MKRALLFAFLISASFNILAQGNDTLRKYDREMDDSTEIVYTQVPSIKRADNIVKLNVTSLLLKNVSLQYERILTKHMSVAMGLRLMPKSRLPFSNAIENSIGDEDPETLKFVQDTRVGGFAITPEFRYYVGAGYGKGFYLAPYLRYQRFNIESIYAFEDDQNTIQNIDFKGDYNNFGIGLMVGSQFMLGKYITLDWWILGPQYGSNKLNLRASGFNLSDDDVNTLRNDITDVEFLGIKPETDISNTNATIKASKGFAAIRGFGLCLGFRF